MCSFWITDSSPLSSFVLPVNSTVTGTPNHSSTVSLILRSVRRFSSSSPPPCTSSIVSLSPSSTAVESRNVPLRLASSSRTRSSTAGRHSADHSSGAKRGAISTRMPGRMRSRSPSFNARSALYGVKRGKTVRIRTACFSR